MTISTPGEPANSRGLGRFAGLGEVRLLDSQPLDPIAHGSKSDAEKLGRRGAVVTIASGARPENRTSL
jgi:hypothetical protein